MNPDFVLVATDLAPSNALALIQKKINCVAFLGKGESVMNHDGIAGAIMNAKTVLIGMSSSEERSEPEIFAAHCAYDLGKRVGLYADAPGCYARPWFANIRNKVSFVSVINEKEATNARRMFPPSVEVAPVGNPDWDKYFFVKRTSAEVRATLGIADDQKMIFVSGHKMTMITVPTLAIVLHAVAKLNDRRIIIVYGAHPGATLPWKEYAGVHYSGVAVKLTVRKPADVLAGSPFESTDLTEEEMIAGADLVIGECSTAEVGAACQRKPAIAFMTEMTLGRNAEIFGRREWEWAEANTSVAVHGEPRALARAIMSLLNPINRDYQKIQESIIPRPERPGIALEKLVELMERHASLVS